MMRRDEAINTTVKSIMFTDPSMAPWQYDYNPEKVKRSYLTTLIIADSHGRHLRKHLERASKRHPGRRTEAFIVAYKPGGQLDDAQRFLARLSCPNEVAPGLYTNVTKVVLHIGTNDLVTRDGKSRPENVGPRCGLLLAKLRRLRDDYDWFFECRCYISPPLPRKLEIKLVHQWHNDTIR